MLAYKVLGAGLSPFAVSAMCTDAKTGISAAGTTQGTATGLTNAVNYVGTVAANSGVILSSSAAAGDCQVVFNGGANTLKIYPDTGAQINAAGANNAVSLLVNTAAELWRCSTTQWVMVTSS